MAEKILLGMSGGVDSCAAAIRLIEQGYDVTGLTLELWGDCRSNIESARQAAEKLGIRHITADMREAFAREVVKPFSEEYFSGRTPNPCILCNRAIKFGAMLDFALQNGFDKIATGHYAVLERRGDTVILKPAPSEKDQSYFLSMLTQEQLSHAVFPLGNMEKSEVRALAEKAGMLSAKRRDSQEICFVPDNDYAAFLTDFTGKECPDGDFIDENGKVLGRHRGIIRYTVGQRKGLGIALGKPMFVTDINSESNTVTLGENGSQYSDFLIADNVNFPSGNIDGEFEATVKIRCRAVPAAAKISFLPDGKMRADFREPQRSVTKGQTAAVYLDNCVVCAGRIIGRGTDK